MALPSLLDPRRDEIRVAPRMSPVLLMPRRVPGGVLATLDALPGEALPRLDYEGPTSGLRRAMRAALAERLPRPRWLANWLLDDVLAHAAMLAALAGASSLHVTMGAAGGGAEAGLTAAEARCRLVTAYRGFGFDWLPPRAAAGLAAGQAPSARDLAGLLRRLPRGDVAILRGDGDGPGVAHRVATGAGPGPGAALLLTIDEASHPGLGAPAVADRRPGGLRSRPDRPRTRPDQLPNSRASTAS